MKRFSVMRSRAALLVGLSLGALGLAQARPVALGGVLISPRTETRTLSGGAEGLPVAVLPRLGVQVQGGAGLSLSYGGRTLTYFGGRWLAQGVMSVPTTLPIPEYSNGGQYVGLGVLLALGVPTLADTPDVLDFAPEGRARPVQTGEILPVAPAPLTPPPPFLPSPVVQPPAPQPPVVQPPVPQPSVLQPPAPPPFTPVSALASVRSSRTLDRNIELQRVVLEFSAQAPYTLTRDRSGLNIALPGVSSEPQTLPLESGDDLGVSLGAAGSSVRLDTRGGVSEVFTLQDPYRIVIDTTTNIDTSVPPPIETAALPDGVTLRRMGGLSLLIFDARYTPKVVAAPLGRASGVADLVKQGGGVAGVNGGYFDPASGLPVDLVALGGLMVSPSLEKRATLGLDAQGTPKLGYPRPRYVLSGPGLQLTVNSVGARPNPLWVTAFVGDGRTVVGADALTTLVLQGGLSAAGSGAPATGVVARALTGRFVPAAGEFAVTFDPGRFPQLALPTGSLLSYSLNWQTPGWDGTQQALAAGPLLVAGGRVVLDPVREGFDTSGSIWRATRQVAFITVGTQTGVAFLSSGTPTDFARALLGAGVSSALRLDSGSSATVYVTGGYFNAGGYLNTVWSRAVPNALIFVPKASALGTGAAGR